MAQVFLNLPVTVPPPCFAHAVPLDLPFKPTSLVCLSESFCSSGLGSNAVSFRKEFLISPHQHILVLCPPPRWAAPVYSPFSLQHTQLFPQLFR